MITGYAPIVMGDDVDNGGKRFSLSFNLGHAATIITVIIMVGGIWSSQVQFADNLKYRMDNIDSEFKVLSDRLQALSLGTTERFASIDNSVMAIEKRVDAVVTDEKIDEGKLVIMEAEVKALQDELRVFSPNKK